MIVLDCQNSIPTRLKKIQPLPDMKSNMQPQKQSSFNYTDDDIKMPGQLSPQQWQLIDTRWHEGRGEELKAWGDHEGLLRLARSIDEELGWPAASEGGECHMTSVVIFFCESFASNTTINDFSQNNTNSCPQLCFSSCFGHEGRSLGSQMLAGERRKRVIAPWHPNELTMTSLELQKKAEKG